MSQAAEFMGLRKDTQIESLYPKMFGKLVVNRYEFRFTDDQTPWFYEKREELVPPSRYMVEVTDSVGLTREIYSTKTLLKDYQLYDSPHGKSIPALAEYGNQLYSDKRFVVRDSYIESRFRTTRSTKQSRVISIRATSPSGTINDFDSLTKCARYFNVDRSSIQNRLDNGKDLDGWTFTITASFTSNGE
jgi:hypothetical protein